MVLDCHRLFGFEALFQLIDYQLRHHRDFVPEMDEAADTVDVPNVVQSFAKIAADKKIAGEKRLHDSHDTTTGCSLQSKARVKYLQSEVTSQCRRGNVLMLGLRPDAIPRWWVNRSNFRKSQVVPYSSTQFGNRNTNTINVSRLTVGSFIRRVVQFESVLSQVQHLGIGARDGLCARNFS